MAIYSLWTKSLCKGTSAHRGNRIRPQKEGKKKRWLENWWKKREFCQSKGSGCWWQMLVRGISSLLQTCLRWHNSPRDFLSQHVSGPAARKGDSVSPLPTKVAHFLFKNLSTRCSSLSVLTCLFLLTLNIHHAKSMPACFPSILVL